MTRPKQKSKNRSRNGPPQGKEEKTTHNEAKQGETLPYTIQHSSVFGRYLEAGKDLPAGTLLLQEQPLVVGPSQESAPICIGCYAALKAAWRCNKCGFPLCSSSCPGKDSKTGHSALECQTLAKTPLKTISGIVLSSNLDAVAPLRCLMLREADPTAWAVISAMEAHTDKRRNVETLWRSNQRKVVDVIRGQWGLLEFEEEVIHHVCGVLEVNAFEVGTSLRAIYPTAYLFPHSCVPNTRHSDDAAFNITFRTTTPVRKTEMLFVTYTYVLQGTMKRRQHLRDTKFFECECARCRDPTECGSHVSAVKCPLCLDGLVESTQPLDLEANWTCHSTECPGYVILGTAVATMIGRISNELDSIDGNDIQEYEAFLKKHSRTVSESHYLSLSAMHCLFQLYGKIDGYLINNLTDQQLARKVEICRALLAAFDKLDPGLSKQRGLILYELHAPLMIALQRGQQEKRLAKQDMKRKLREVVKCLEEAVKLLQVEPAGSQEAQMAAAAGEALERLASWQIINQ